MSTTKEQKQDPLSYHLRVEWCSVSQFLNRDRSPELTVINDEPTTLPNVLELLCSVEDRLFDVRKVKSIGLPVPIVIKEDKLTVDILKAILPFSSHAKIGKEVLLYLEKGNSLKIPNHLTRKLNYVKKDIRKRPPGKKL
ncbi:hypothetical protein [[Flexibacter] sp. ATCC 35208]|uniref:hypothetical protein n=1 Tax=[Flexibacter] sp. ATCC 35208 TaxID=1936242 RepID=UPI0009D34C02|nr:hypothetical protein [[Flexibacter] sp. ATCC 35208]OMP80098.1 hypothetical protein BW716_06290 [[Flexibacter] sp. ATCC 35208]